MVQKCVKCGEDLIEGDNWAPYMIERNYHTCRECIRKYQRAYVMQKSRDRGVLPMSDNRECPSFLGCHIAEQVLSKTFKDVEIMPPSNPGYDFICNKGKKIDVKSSCLRYKNPKHKSWMFVINKNKVADYFMCIAFDDRTNLNPLHLWLLPSKICNNKTAIGVSESTISKWDEYKLDISDAVKCCNMMKKQ